MHFPHLFFRGEGAQVESLPCCRSWVASFPLAGSFCWPRTRTAIVGHICVGLTGFCRSRHDG
ncbi:hypothetical protein BU14_0475s0003 [Porphyra umbilicalis]|uniref:Uncharacterized protein n=1 Tax=Porphyra umbilicalis TaxID=2786 RepID=A0A1X6NU66_PORUM|nr:hypothetical protein BU14_0475s0003 [Porphyra umbilicalis]|eukprot:OSX72050.1 hypothetical protein BU14_0475s0003 [Porphyra umbilicalis]